TGGTANLDHSLVYGNTSGYSIRYTGGGGTLDYDTIANNTSGGIISSTLGALTVRNSVITNNGNYGFVATAGAPSFTYSDVWSNSTNSSGVTLGAGVFSSNPLYVGGSNYRLTSNSPAHLADTPGTGDLGPLPYVSDATSPLQGTL